MKLASRTFRGFAVTAALVAVAVAAVGFGARPAAAQGAPSVNPGGPYIGAVNVPITFNASASTGGPIINYAWNFGDGTTGNGSIAQKSYTTAGAFTVTLTVITNNGVSASATTTANVSALPAGTAYPAISPYAIGSAISPYAIGSAISPFAIGSAISPFLNTGVISPFLNTGVISPFLNTGVPCGVPVLSGSGTVVTSACSGPFVNTTFPFTGFTGVGCFNQPFATQFGTSFRRICR